MLKGFLITLGLALLIYIIFVTRNLIIITIIKKKSLQLSNETNYHYKINTFDKDGNSLNNSEIFRDDDTTKTITKDSIVWKNKTLNQTITLYPNTKTKTIRNEYFESTVPTILIDNSFSQNILLSLKSIILINNFDNQKCYILNINNSKYYITKYTKLILKISQENLNTQYSDFHLNTVINSEVTIPASNDYTIKNTSDINIKKSL